MHHKRKRPKNRRAGCLMCKPQKANGADRRTFPEIRKDVADFVDYEFRNNAHRKTSI
jgi:hypothetical protein